MAKRKHTPEEIINKLKEAEVVIAAGSTPWLKPAGASGCPSRPSTAGRPSTGGLRIDQARRLKRLETEIGRIKRAVAELTLDNQILRESAEGNF